MEERLAAPVTVFSMASSTMDFGLGAIDAAAVVAAVDEDNEGDEGATKVRLAFSLFWAS